MGATLRQYLAAAACTLSVAMTAACFTWMEPLMRRLTAPDSEIPMTTDDTSWLVSSVEFGEVFITLPAGLLADRYGRKTVLLSTGPMCMISWILILTTRSLPVLYLVRLMQGAALAVVFTVGPMYLAEIADPRIRGELSGQFQTMWYVGITYVYLTGPFLSYQNYAFALSVVPFLFLACFILMPESPYYHLMMERPKAALQSLTWLRASKDVNDEFQNIQSSVQEDMKESGGWRDLFATKKDRRAFMIVQVVCFVKYLNGMPAIVTYATSTFAQTAKGVIDHHYMTIGLGSLLCVTTFFAAFMSDSVGRRPLLIYSTLASVFFNVITGIYYFLETETDYDVSSYAWVMYTSVACFCVVANVGLGPLMQTIQAEFFPSNTRGIGSGVTEISASIATFINLKQYQTVADMFGVYMNFFIFAFFGFVGTLVIICILPETAGKSLGQIQNEFVKETIAMEQIEQQSHPKINKEDCSTHM